ncbi:MAG: PQQ-binding-like beta-propeller repeat protein [Pirellulales bacterium]|nr:PQQ-binding-like beta-propeller repeat protein [Pirellulales bacterium]
MPHRFHPPAQVLTLLAVSVLATAGPRFLAHSADRGQAPNTRTSAVSSDWPQWGGSPSRNNAPNARKLPVEWTVGEFDFRTGKWLGGDVKNVRWVAKLGSESYGSPAVAGGKVFCATNNAGYVARYPASVDLGCLLCFRQPDGEFLWQHSAEKLKDHEIDWPKQGICCTPLVEADRAWLVTNRGEVVCLDTEGFRDGENDGPFASEPSSDKNESDVVWRYDMMAELGTIQHNMASCSVTAAGGLLLVHTSNGIDSSHRSVPAPKAPSFIALDKRAGRLVWADRSPGENILHGQWASPAHAVLGGVPQAIFPGGDGWVYSFLAEPGSDGKPRLLWRFDCNPKESVWGDGGEGDRNTIIATPVIYDGLVYIATGEDPEAGEGPGILWCIDPTRRGDVSRELVVDRQGRVVPPRRGLAVDKDAGESVRPNANSAAVWKYTGHDANKDGELAFEETMHRTLSMAAIRDGLLVIGDFAGLVHCLDPKTGRPHWTHDMLAAVWGSPMLADGKTYLGNEDGDMVVFELSPKLNVLAKNNMGNAIYGSAVAVGDTLYISTRSHLFAIAETATQPMTNDQ